MQILNEPDHTPQTLTQMMVLADPMSWHLRQASKLVRTAGRFTSHILVEGCGRTVSAKSILAILSLIGDAEGIFNIRATGADAREALQAISSECLCEEPVIL